VFGLGGTTLHYQGEAHRFEPGAFKTLSRYGFGTDWPIDYADLEPYYELAENVLGVAGDPVNPFKAPRGPFPTPAHPLSRASRKVARAARGFGWTLLPNTLALPTRSVDGRLPCQRSGGCVQGCIYGAKSSVDLTAVARAERTGRLHLMTNTRAVRLEEAAGGRIGAVVCKTSGGLERVRGRVFVMSLGALETPRLLLASESASFPNGVGNDEGQVGLNFMETLWVAVTAQFDEELHPYIGPPIDARIWNFVRPANHSGRSGYGIGVSGSISGLIGPVSYARRIPGIGLEHKNAMRDLFGTVATIFGVADHEPRRVNRVSLDSTNDADGVPMLRVDSRWSANDLDAFRTLRTRCMELARAAGATRILSINSTYDRPNASHVGGTCRMGRRARSSGVDAFGKIHDVANLFVADASVLPGQGGGDSPSLTIQALALRTADRIVELFRRGEA